LGDDASLSTACVKTWMPGASPGTTDNIVISIAYVLAGLDPAIHVLLSACIAEVNRTPVDMIRDPSDAHAENILARLAPNGARWRGNFFGYS
jgi:hypothetical protein